MTDGPAYWPDTAGGTSFAAGGFYFDGSIIQNGHASPLTMDRPGLGNRLETMGETTVRQVYWLGGNHPVNAAPYTLTVDVQVAAEADYWTIREAADRGSVVEVWFDWPMTDWWYVPGGDGTVTEWRTSRPLPYSKVTGITQATRPPKVWIDATTQTVNTSGSASSGVVVLPDSSGYQFLETIALAIDTYTWIKLRYHPMLLVSIESISEAHPQHNDLVFQMELFEHLGGLYTYAGGGGGGGP